MTITTRGRYGIQALTDLAVNGESRPVSLTEIAERQQISMSYLEQIFATLKKNGLVKSVRGASGGYRLARQAQEITALDILTVLEGDLSFTGDVPSDPSTITRSACNQVLWGALDARMRDFLRSIRLADLRDEVLRETATAGDFYCI